MFALGLKLAQDALAFLQPQLLRWLLAYISTYQTSKVSDGTPPAVFEGFAVAALMFGASLIQTVVLHQVGPFARLCQLVFDATFGNSTSNTALKRA